MNEPQSRVIPHDLTAPVVNEQVVITAQQNSVQDIRLAVITFPVFRVMCFAPTGGRSQSPNMQPPWAAASVNWCRVENSG